MQEITRLKTCPFCGSNNLMKIDKKDYGVPTDLISYIECKNCGIRTRIFSENSKETVEEFWNRRDGEPMKEFPCKIGDTVYWVWVGDRGDSGIFKGKISGLSIGQNRVAWFSVVYENGLTFDHTFKDYWGKAVFMDEEQAIAKYDELFYMMKTVKIIGPRSKYIEGQGWTTEVPVDKLEELGFTKLSEAEGARKLAEAIMSHYPHTISIQNTIEKELLKYLKSLGF